MSRIRKNHSSSFKLKVALKALSNESTIAEICQEFSVSKSAVHKWVKILKENGNKIFDTASKSVKNKEYESDISKLHSKIGELVVERDFLKKLLDA